MRRSGISARLRRTIRDELGVIAKFGVPPVSIPDYLALVGDSSDGYPGIAGWGAKSAAGVLAVAALLLFTMVLLLARLRKA